MKVKDNTVKINELSEKLKGKLSLIEKAIKVIEGENYEMTITSAVDGKHMAGSKHYKGMAIDIRSRDMNDKKNVVRILNSVFWRWIIILEKDHIHIQID